MGYYSYKFVRDQLPAYVKDAIPDYEGEPNYDGDQWTAASIYIEDLQAALIAAVKAGSVIANEPLRAHIASLIARNPHIYGTTEAHNG